jgi:hypothetical protein
MILSRLGKHKMVKAVAVVLSLVGARAALAICCPDTGPGCGLPECIPSSIASFAACSEESNCSDVCCKVDTFICGPDQNPADWCRVRTSIAGYCPNPRNPNHCDWS